MCFELSMYYTDFLFMHIPSRVCHHQKGGICWNVDFNILILSVLVMINTIAFDSFSVSLSISEKDQCKEQLSCRG